MKKILIITIISLLVATPILAATNLYEYFKEQGEILPTVEERTPLANQCGIENYKGHYDQNVELLECIDEEEVFGATIPVVVSTFETSLASKITASSTSLTLVSGTDKAGNDLSGYICYVIDEGASVEEFVCGTTSGTAVTSLLRGISPTDGDTDVYSLKKSHRRGSSVKITNYPQLAILSRILNGDETIPNIISYDSQPTFTGDEEIITKKYADDLTNQGAATGTTETAGIFEAARRHEAGAGTDTGGSGYNLVLPASIATTTREVATSSVMMSDVLGYISQTFFNFNTLWQFGSTTHASTTIASNAHIGGNLSIAGDADIDGHATTTGTLEVGENINLTGELRATGRITVAGINSEMASTTFNGTSTFKGLPFGPETTPTDDQQFANKAYVDTKELVCESGTDTRAANTGAGSQVITTTFLPRTISITAMRSDDSNMKTSIGFAEAIGSISQNVVTNVGTGAVDNNDIIYLCGNTGGGNCSANFFADVSAVAATSFTLNWDATPNDSDTVYFLWEACR